MKLSVVIPCLNEAQSIEGVVDDAVRVLARLEPDYEIVVVDDGSTDGTSRVVQALSARNDRVCLVRHGANRGYGAALRTGFARATGDLVFFTDGDGQFDLAQLQDLVPFIDRHGIVAGYRERRSDPFPRRVNAALWNALVRLLFGLRVRDVNCAFKLIRREVLQSVELRSNGALINTELFVRAGRAGFEVHEVPTRHYPRRSGVPTGARLGVIARAFRELLELRKELAGPGGMRRAPP